MSTTVIDVVRLATTFLTGRGIPGARLDAELLAAHSLGLRRLDLYLQHDRPLREEELEPIRGLLRRRATGVPVAYLLGRREFHGRTFTVSSAVLVPRPETEVLVDRVLGWARARAGAAGAGLCIADLGTGSACVAATLAAELPEARVVAVDVSEPALEVARMNAEALGVADRVELVAGDWCVALAPGLRVDALVSNPPYVPSGEIAGLDRDVRDNEPRVALDGGPDGLDATRALLAGAAGRVGAGGLVALEVDCRAAAAVAGMLVAGFPGSTVTVTRDLAGHDRVVEALVR